MKAEVITDFEKFAKALSDYQKKDKSYDSFYEEIKDLDCFDFRFFYYKAHYLYKKLKKIEEAKMYIDKSIEAIPMIIRDVFSRTENSQFIYVLDDNLNVVPIAGLNNELISNIYTLAGEIYSTQELDDDALKYYKSAMYYKTFVKTVMEEKEYVYLYSFRRFNQYSLSDLINNEITVSPSKCMNDPFDSIINLWGSEEQLEKTCKERKHIKNLNKSFDYFRIRSFCNGETEEALKSLLMWSHYADEHHGYCIKYKLSKHFIKQEENENDEHMYLKPIIYRKDKEIVDISEMTTIDTNLAFATKHDSWGYENEVRLIVYNPNKEENFYGVPLDKDSCIEAIYFGYKCAGNTIKTIMKLFSKADATPKFYKMCLNNKDVYHPIAEEIK